VGKGFDVGKKRTKTRELVFQIMVGQKKYKKIAPESLYLKLASGAMHTKTKILAPYNRQRCSGGC
jgi:hypothetical protein